MDIKTLSLLVAVFAIAGLTIGWNSWVNAQALRDVAGSIPAILETIVQRAPGALPPA